MYLTRHFVWLPEPIEGIDYRDMCAALAAWLNANATTFPDYNGVTVRASFEVRKPRIGEACGMYLLDYRYRVHSHTAERPGFDVVSNLMRRAIDAVCRGVSA
jgi:hypothetical protein